MSVFHFKHFSIQQFHSTLKVGTDAMVLGALCDKTGANRILDIGAGTGVLSLMLLQKNTNASVVAVEMDSDTCIDLKENLIQNPFGKNATCLNIDFLSWQTETEFDLIISNPPYYEHTLLSDNEKVNSAKHVSSLDLKALLKRSFELLTHEGEFWFIWPVDHQENLFHKINDSDFYLAKDITIYGKPGLAKRKVICLRKTHSETEVFDFLIRGESESYSTQYKELTKEYHNKTL
jgi:tRNA1Val (adenine37-N6)-methyltransferase